MRSHERDAYDDMLDMPERGRSEPVDAAEEARLAEAVSRLNQIRGLKEQAATAMALVERYRLEEGVGGARERACLDVVAGCNLRIREIRRNWPKREQ